MDVYIVASLPGIKTHIDSVWVVESLAERRRDERNGNDLNSGVVWTVWLRPIKGGFPEGDTK